MKTSIVIPVFNAELSIERLVLEIKNTFTEYNIEIILVNDSSDDNSDEICSLIAKKDDKVKYICLRKNSGEHNAVMCGLNHTEGDYVIIMDDDFQNPPSEALKLLKFSIENSFDVVYSKYALKKHHFLRNLGSFFNDFCSSFLINKPKGLYLSSFKLINKEIVDEVIKYKGPFPYIDGLIFRYTNNVSSLLVEHMNRKEGKSNYTITKLVSLYFNMLFNFSAKPLRLFTIIGIILFIVGLLSSFWIIIEKIISPNIPVGYASIAVIITIFSSIQLMFLGLISEYIGKTYLDMNNTPQFTIKKKIINMKQDGK